MEYSKDGEHPHLSYYSGILENPKKPSYVFTAHAGKLFFRDQLVVLFNDRISRTANDLRCIVFDNPNKLIHDEVDIVRDLGVNVEVKPSEIKYYLDSRRVTTIWQAYTTGEKEAIKLGIAAPPNDVIKKEKMKCMIEDNPAKTEEAMSELRKNNIEFELWWK